LAPFAQRIDSGDASEAGLVLTGPVGSRWPSPGFSDVHLSTFRSQTAGVAPRSFGAVWSLRAEDQPVALTDPTGSPGDRLVTALLLAVGLVVSAIGILALIASLHFETVVSNSMRPTFSAGDVAVTQAVPISSLRVGDAIAFYPPGKTEPVLHRITSLETTAAGVVVTTRGDANPVDDLWRAALTGTTAYRLVAVVPFIGWSTELQRPAFLVAGLLLGLWILLELRKEVAGRTEKSRSRSRS
jgi:signal peptidase I